MQGVALGSAPARSLQREGKVLLGSRSNLALGQALR